MTELAHEVVEDLAVEFGGACPFPVMREWLGTDAADLAATVASLRSKGLISVRRNVLAMRPESQKWTRHDP